ncbi:TPA: Dephospho-CoA kinase cab5 [Trebouxia sp. C0004]
MVFHVHDARRRLNSATHLPVALELVRQLAVEWLSLTSVAVVDMPLLFETGSHKLVWPRVIVTCSHETEVERLMKRDACSKPEAEAKVKAQMPLRLKQNKSQIVIDNSGNKHHCEQQVQQLVRQLQGKYKWLGFATSPVVFVGMVWLLLRVLRLSSA